MTRFCRQSCASRRTRSAGTPRRSISTRCSRECWPNSDTRRCTTPSGCPRCPCRCIGCATDCPSGAISRRGAAAKLRCSAWLTNWKRRGHGRRSARLFLPPEYLLLVHSGISPKGHTQSERIGDIKTERREVSQLVCTSRNIFTPFLNYKYTPNPTPYPISSTFIFFTTKDVTTLSKQRLTYETAAC